MSIANSVILGSSRYATNIHKYYFRLKEAMRVVKEDDTGIGGKLLALNLKELQTTRKELDTAWDKAKSQGDFPEELREELEAAVETLPRLERQVATAQDSLEEEEKLQRVGLAQRPKSKFSDFHGESQE